MASRSRFFYHAFAVPLSGSINRPVVHNLDGHAISALPRYGGHASASAPPFLLSNLLAHAGASSHVSGLYQDETDTHETVVEATLKGLDLEGVVKIQSLTSAIQSSHPGHKQEDPKITIKGSQMLGITINGQTIELESWVDLLSQLDTLEALREYYKKDSAFQEKFNEVAYVGRGSDLPDKVKRFFPWRNWKGTGELPVHNNMAIVPIFRVTTPSTDQFKVFGNVIQITNFGRIQLGELIVEANQRRLMMVHAALGSPCDGNITGGCSGGNGSAPPPQNGN